MEGVIAVQEYFIKMGSEYFAARDIFDQNGVLLLGKGQKVTTNIKKRLGRFGIYEHGTPGRPGSEQSPVSQTCDGQGADLHQITNELKNRLDIRNERIFRKANDILGNIVFDSRTQPWWIFVNALSNYVGWIYTHSIDVAIISVMMAAEIGYNEEELSWLGIGTLLHDVGKLLVPKSIILKSEILTDMETALLRQHCELGISSLASISFPREYLDVVSQHHERLDGSGYPKGLKGDEISRNARIAIVADVVDEISSARPGRQAQPMEAVIWHLKNENEKYPQEYVVVLEDVLGFRHAS